MPEHIVNVPADTQTVRNFINAERELILRDFSAMRTQITSALEGQPVYKIYGRDEKQGGDAIKHLRKIRLKFNDYYQRAGESQGSLWAVPDIIGFTVVVHYPTDISSICRVVDRLIENGSLLNGSTGTVGVTSSAAFDVIKTRFGRPIVSDGYFACHYNLRIKNVNIHRPLCEIQIKTILHDAWGAKTHDLTYKPSGKISEDLVGSFNLLGDTLAKIDQQSDLVRQSIERSSAPREFKKKLVRLATIEHAAEVACIVPELRDALNVISTVAPTSGQIILKNCVDLLYQCFQTHPKETCYLYAVLAVLSKNESIRQQTLDALETSYEGLSGVFDQIFARNVAGLISYCSGDLTSAIDFGEEAHRLAIEIDQSSLDDASSVRLTRLLNALYSSLGYYHADLIGSHDGRLAGSYEKSLQYIEMGKSFRATLGIPDLGLESEDAEIIACLAIDDTKQFARVFQSLENEAFIRIQTAQSEIVVRNLRKKLDLIYKQKPAGILPQADKFFDYHDYCARARLAELECSEAYSPSSS